jgi:hypothetical protein
MGMQDFMCVHPVLESFYYERTQNKDAQIKIISILCLNTILIMWVFGATFKLNSMLLLKIEKIKTHQ